MGDGFDLLGPVAEHGDRGMGGEIGGEEGAEGADTDNNDIHSWFRHRFGLKSH